MDPKVPRFLPAAKTVAAFAVMATSFGSVEMATANSYNWGDGSTVCPDEEFQEGICVMATSPQQVVKGTTSLQYMVSCADAPGGLYSQGTYVQPTAYGLPAGSFASFVAWTSSSGSISGEVVTTQATSVVWDSSGNVVAYGATPVKVYNSQVFWDSSTVTFGAACEADQWVPTAQSVGPLTADSWARTVSRKRSLAAASAERAARKFATGERKRQEFQVRVRSVAGVDIHDRVNLKARTATRATLTCPRGMRPAGDPQISYGFDATRDVSGYKPRIIAKRTWSKRGVSISYRAARLKYPTVSYTILPCANK
jgi:hypothetical protein